jgi:addiction module HigA family antidote
MLIWWTTIEEGRTMAMRMKNPPHPGGLIRDDIEALGLTVAEAAEGLDVTRQQLYRVIRGESGISPEMAVRLEKALGGSADFWLRLQISHEVAQVRQRPERINVKRLTSKIA